MSLFFLYIVLALLVPGVIWSHLLIPFGTGKGALRIVERLVLAFGTGLVLVPLTAFVLNPFLDIGAEDMPLIVIILSMTGAVAVLVRRSRRERASPFSQKGMEEGERE